MLYLLTVLTAVGMFLVVYESPSKDYWANVGPQWDQMLNPCDYKECNID